MYHLKNAIWNYSPEKNPV